MSDAFSHHPVIAEPPLGHIDALPEGTRLGEFELQGLLGVGGFGMVYKGYDHSLHRPVAIKEYMPSALVGRVAEMQVSVRSTTDAQTFRAGLTSFIAEARLLARFDHPSLVKVYRFWEANNTAYMAMPLYQGITLKQARSQMSAPPPEAWLRTVLWSVVEALKLLHSNGTIHRDVSPDNIFLQDTGPPVLLDLGAARRAVLDHSHKHTAVLKVNYAPIEQYADAKDLQEGPWTDLYALGAVVHGCLRNEPPLPATIRAVRDRMPSFFRVAQTVQTHLGTAYSLTFINAISHTLIVEPAHRTQNTFDFCEEMQLLAPENLPHFDWREELGDSVTLGHVMPDLLLLPEDTQAVEKTQIQPHIPAIAHAKRISRSKRKHRSRGSAAQVEGEVSSEIDVRPQLLLRWLVLFLFAASLALGVAAWVHYENESPKLSEPLAAQASADRSVDAAVSVRAADKVSPRAEEPLPAPSAASVDSAAPKQVAAPEPTSKPERAEPPARKSSKVPPSAGPTRAAKPDSSEKSPASPPHTVPVEGRHAAAEAASPSVTSKTPEEICAKNSVWTRSMCHFQLCQKREFATLPFCIDAVKKWEKREIPDVGN